MIVIVRGGSNAVGDESEGLSTSVEDVHLGRSTAHQAPLFSVSVPLPFDVLARACSTLPNGGGGGGGKRCGADAGGHGADSDSDLDSDDDVDLDEGNAVVDEHEEGGRKPVFQTSGQDCSLELRRKELWACVVPLPVSLSFHPKAGTSGSMSTAHYQAPHIGMHLSVYLSGDQSSSPASSGCVSAESPSAHLYLTGTKCPVDEAQPLAATTRDASSRSGGVGWGVCIPLLQLPLSPANDAVDLALPLQLPSVLTHPALVDLRSASVHAKAAAIKPAAPALEGAAHASEARAWDGTLLQRDQIFEAAADALAVARTFRSTVPPLASLSAWFPPHVLTAIPQRCHGTLGGEAGLLVPLESPALKCSWSAASPPISGHAALHGIIGGIGSTGGDCYVSGFPVSIVPDGSGAADPGRHISPPLGDAPDASKGHTLAAGLPGACILRMAASRRDIAAIHKRMSGRNRVGRKIQAPQSSMVRNAQGAAGIPAAFVALGAGGGASAERGGGATIQVGAADEAARARLLAPAMESLADSAIVEAVLRALLLPGCTGGGGVEAMRAGHEAWRLLSTIRAPATAVSAAAYDLGVAAAVGLASAREAFGWDVSSGGSGDGSGVGGEARTWTALACAVAKDALNGGLMRISVALEQPCTQSLPPHPSAGATLFLAVHLVATSSASLLALRAALSRRISSFVLQTRVAAGLLSESRPARSAAGLSTPLGWTGG
jgi:hypothetical protein